MAAATAIVTSPNAGAGEVLRTAVTDHPRRRQFRRRSAEAAGLSGLRREFEARRLERARDFSAEAIAERYLQIYRNVAQ